MRHLRPFSYPGDGWSGTMCGVDGNPVGAKYVVAMRDGDAAVFERFFTQDESALIFNDLLETTRWRRDEITLFGRTVPLPRLTAWHGDPGAVYSYSKIRMAPEPWTQPLLTVKALVDGAAGIRFNSVLANLYRDGRDHMSWHADDEPELGPEPVIASVSFGAARRFLFKPKDKSDPTRVEIELGPGSLLLMRGPTQTHWLHSIPKSARVAAPRINLTFRLTFRP